MHSMRTCWQVANGNLLALGIAPRVTLGGEDDGDTEPWSRVHTYGVEATLDTSLQALQSVSALADSSRWPYEQDCGEVSVLAQKEHQRLGLRVPKAHVVLEYLGTGRC